MKYFVILRNQGVLKNNSPRVRLSLIPDVVDVKLKVETFLDHLS